MDTICATQKFTLEPYDTKRLASLCGRLDEHLRQIEDGLSIEIRNRGNVFQVSGNEGDVEATIKLLESLYDETQKGESLSPETVHLHIRGNQHFDQQLQLSHQEPALIKTRRVLIRPRGESQQNYVKQIQSLDISFGIGPAGTGKTYLAVACAVDALEKENVNRILLVRPAVEAGEKLGFLPGDLAEKINPYLRPLYDALYEMFGFEKVARLMEKSIIEVAPLAYMRGRTLNNSFIILDEAQNTTEEQMKMFLTRIGFGSKAVITGDITQIDLPKGVKSGLKHALQVVKSIDEIGITHFAAKDVVRHSLVQKLVEAYDALESGKNS